MPDGRSRSIILCLVVTLSVLLAACTKEAAEETAAPTATTEPTVTSAVTLAPQVTLTPTVTSAPTSTPTIPPAAATATEETVPEMTQTPPPSGLMAVIVGGDSAVLGKPFTFDATQSQAGAAPIVTYQWDMADGTTLFGAAIQHGYAQPGIYTVTLTITDGGGQSDTTTKVVEVIDATEATATAAATAESAFSLVGTSWVMNNAVRGTTVTLAFDEGSLAGSSGCNRYNASYTASAIGDATFTISVGPIGATSESCTLEIMAQEKGYLDSLASANRVTVDGSVLVMETSSGALTFSQSEGSD